MTGALPCVDALLNQAGELSDELILCDAGIHDSDLQISDSPCCIWKNSAVVFSSRRRALRRFTLSRSFMLARSRFLAIFSRNEAVLIKDIARASLSERGELGAAWDASGAAGGFEVMELAPMSLDVLMKCSALHLLPQPRLKKVLQVQFANRRHDPLGSRLMGPSAVLAREPVRLRRMFFRPAHAGWQG